jgi:3-hydroxybutyryl-CoA dehydrogenase
MAIRKIGVVGCGLMGGGIAQTCAQSGYEMVIREVNQALLDKGMARIFAAWDMMASKGKLSQGQGQLPAHPLFAGGYSHVGEWHGLA